MMQTLTTSGSPDKPGVASLLKWSGLLAGIAYLLFMVAKNEVPVDSGDGLSHYAYARNSWDFHENFFSHWAKPLFTLLSSPFAQLGYEAYVCFNVIVYVLTCITAFGIFRRFGTGSAYYLFFPLYLLTVPDYIRCVLGGLTEPLFGLLLLVMISCAFRGKWIAFAIVASFTIFARSEGMLLICFGFLLLVYNRAWKAVPFLFAGFVVYGFAGMTVDKSFSWYFTEDPYVSFAPYGHGEWNHYIASWRNYIGIGLLVLLPFSAFGWYVMHKMKERKPNGTALFAVAVFVVIIAVHAYLWTYGLKGALGLTRLAVLGLTGFSVIVFLGLDRVTRELHVLTHSLLFILCCGYVVYKERPLPYPLKPDPFEQLVLESADFVKRSYPNRKVKYFHPLFGFRAGSRMMNDPDISMYWFEADPKKIHALENGEIIVRDGLFGPAEAGLPRRMIDSLPELKKVRIFNNGNDFRLYTGEPAQVVIYEVSR